MLIILLVYICVKKNSKRFCLFFMFSKEFVGISSPDTHTTTLVNEGKPMGLNGFLHNLSAIVLSTKVSLVL